MQNNNPKEPKTIVNEENIFPIKGKIFSSPYDWGDNKLIPQTLGFKPEPGKPYAEYWIGTHHKAPAQLILPDGSTYALEDAIKDNPIHILGVDVTKKFGDFPFLFKLLDAGEMLSIQVHPTKEQAEIGFKDENDKGIALDDPKRTYKDDNQKFEFCLALDDFWLLNSFKTEEKLEQTLTEVKEFSFLLPFFGGDYKKLYTHVMVDMSDQEVNDVLDSLAQRILPLYEQGKLDKDNPDFWTAKAIKYMHMEKGSYDRGIFSIYFLNLIHLKKGQAASQGSGVLHAYLHGPIIEVMTTSDNVARGGITPKYIDIDELFKMVNFEGKTPQIIEAQKKGNEEFYNSLNPVYGVSKISIEKDRSYNHTSYSAEIIISFEGNAMIKTDTKTLSLSKGEIIIVFANTAYEITGNESDVIYKTSVPLS